MKLRSDGIVQATPAADYSSYEGYGVTLGITSFKLTATLSASATVVVEGIITEAGTVAQGVAVAIPGSVCGSVHVKLSGTVTGGDKLIQVADGTFVTDSGSGARVVVGIALESGVSGDLIEMAVQTPQVLS